jgi:hypothetical protein
MTIARGLVPFVLRDEPGLFDDAMTGAVVQRLPDGEVSALAASFDGGYRIRFPGSAVFGFRPGSSEMRVGAPASTPNETVERLFRTVAVPFALQVAGYEALHASAVRSAEGVVAFCGHSGSGKTTLAYALALRPGFELWSDDALVLASPATPDGAHVCLNLPQEPNLRPRSREFFDRWSANDPPRAEIEQERLAAAVLLETAPPDAEPDLARLSLPDALTGTLSHAYCFFVDPGREERTVHALVDLAAQVPVFRLRLPTGFDRLDPTLDLLESSVAFPIALV